MKKILALAIELVLLFASGIHVAFAGDIIIKPPPGIISKALNATNIIEFILNVLFAIGVIVSIAFLILGGIRWTTSGGDKIAVESARNQIIAAVVGFIVIIFSFAILRFVISIVGGNQTVLNTLDIPTL